MTTELAFNIQQIVVKPGLIEFNEFESLKEQALELAENINQVEVSDENIQTSKKLLAAVNKKVKELEDKRISIKKEILSPYEAFESQVKEIVTIVKTADEIVRNQVRIIEERERVEKQTALETIFNKRIAHYSFSNIFGFNDFVTSKHLNKSTSIKSIETEMVEWLQKKDADLKVIHSLPNSESVLAEYQDTKDVSVAINIVNDREERKKQLAQFKPKPSTPVSQTFVITLEDEKDFKLVEMFMQSNNIKYKSEKVGN